MIGPFSGFLAPRKAEAIPHPWDCIETRPNLVDSHFFLFDRLSDNLSEQLINNIFVAFYISEKQTVFSLLENIFS